MRCNGQSNWARIAIIIGVGLMASNPAIISASVWYFNDFEDQYDPLSEWSNTSTSTTPGTAQHPADCFLGELENETVTLTLNNLEPHTQVSVAFDFYAILTWDGHNVNGPDVFDVRVEGGETLLHTTFSNYPADTPPPTGRQAFPGDYPGNDNFPRTGAHENNTLGYLYLDTDPWDAVYSFPDPNAHNRILTFDHSGSSIVLEFAASGLFQGAPDSIRETWGLDNVLITPEPAMLSLLAFGGLAMIRRRRRINAEC